MDLSWLAAVLQPYDIAAHPNFGREDDGLVARPSSQLAAHVYGAPGWIQRLGRKDEIDVDSVARAVEKLFHANTTAEGLRLLQAELESPADSDPARRVAITLLVAYGTAEYDDYGASIAVLSHEIDRTADKTAVGMRLLRAALFQQRAARLMDCGQPPEPDVEAVLSLLTGLDTTDCETFPVSAAVGRTSSQTVSDMRQSLVEAAHSLLHPDAILPGDAGDSDPLWIRRLRGSRPDAFMRSRSRVGYELGQWLRTTFDAQISGRPVNSYRGDLFHSALHLELTGHGDSRSAREEMALQRIIAAQSRLITDDDGEALRLLRHAGADRRLDSGLAWFRAHGPISALAADARRVVARLSSVGQARTVEHAVLAGSADVLTPAESSEALDRIMVDGSIVRAVSLPRHTQAPALLLASACDAALALSVGAARESEVALAVLRTLELQQPDELLDQHLARALSTFRWDAITQAARLQWLHWYGSARSGPWSRLRQVVEDQVSAEPESLRIGADQPTVDEVARMLNRLIHGRTYDAKYLAYAVEPVRQAMAAIADQAKKGIQTFGGPFPADVAAGLILHAGFDDLWMSLAQFLAETIVSRKERTPAFERLARYMTAPLPAEVRAYFAQRSTAILEAPDAGHWGEEHAVPYPAALRFLASSGILSATEAFAGTSRLLERGQRTEAAHTVAELCSRFDWAWLESLTVILSMDPDPATKARAGLGLARLVTKRSAQAGGVLSDRLLSLLADDGLLVPLLTLRGLKDAAEIDPVIRPAVAQLESDHPSRSVRTEARLLLASPLGQ